MNFLDLHDDILLAIQGHLDLRTRFQVSRLSRRLRYVSLPQLWETLVTNLSDDEEPRRAQINAMEWMVAGSTTDVCFKLKFVKDVYFRWGDLYGISDPDDEEELSEEEEAYQEELQDFFRLLVRILAEPAPIISLHFHGVFEYGQSPFVLDLFSRLWGPITALPNLRSLDLPKLLAPASLSDFTGIITSWDPPPPSSTLTWLDYGYGVYYEHEHYACSKMTFKSSGTFQTFNRFGSRLSATGPP